FISFIHCLLYYVSFSVTHPPPPTPTLFPYTTLFRSDLAAVIHLCGAGAGRAYAQRGFRPAASQACGEHDLRAYLAQVNTMKRILDRKSTRLNSSHVAISYAVFCLKKKIIIKYILLFI